MQGTSKGSDLSKTEKEWVTVHLRELSTFIDIRIPTTTVFVLSARSLGNSKLCMDHRNKIKVPDPVVKDLTSKK